MPDFIYSITPYFQDGCKIRPEPDTGNTAMTLKLAYGKYAHGNKRVTIAEDRYELINGVSTQVNMAGDVWLQVEEVNGISLDPPAYIAEIHKGQRVATIAQIGTPPIDPPPTTPTDEIVITQTFQAAGYTVSTVVAGSLVTTTLTPESTGQLRE